MAHMMFSLMWSCKHQCGCSEALRWSLHRDEIAMGLCFRERVSVFVYKSLDVARNDTILNSRTSPPPLALMSSCIKSPLLERDCSESGKNSSGAFWHWHCHAGTLITRVQPRTLQWLQSLCDSAGFGNLGNT